MTIAGSKVLLLALAALCASLAACKSANSESGQASAALAMPSLASAGTAPQASVVKGTGKLTILQWPNLLIDGTPARAAPGARIVNHNRLSVTPNQVPADTPVSYEVDGNGQIRVIRFLPLQ